MSPVSEIFTYDESCILHMYAKKTRKEVIRDIEMVLPMIIDPVMTDHCKSLLVKLNSIDNRDFDELDV